jgi:hypothetical protein
LVALRANAVDAAAGAVAWVASVVGLAEAARIEPDGATRFTRAADVAIVSAVPAELSEQSW